MSKRLRNFALTALSGTVLLAVTLVAFYYQSEVRDIKAVWGEQNLILARSLAGSFREYIAPLLDVQAGMDRDELLALPSMSQLEQAVGLSMMGLRIDRVKVYTPEGLTVFSTDRGQIGEDQSANPGVAAALEGQPVSGVVRRGEFNAFDRQVEHSDLLQTYIPLRNNSAEIVGVLELYTDATFPLQRMDQAIRWVLIGVLGSLSVFYALLVWLYARTDRALQREQNATRHYLREVEHAKTTLEERVADRTREVEQSGRFLRAVMDCVPLPVVVIDTDYRITAMNAAAGDLMPRDGNGRHPIFCYQAAHHRDAPCDGIDYPCTLQQVMESGKPMITVHTHFQPDGSARKVEVMGAPLRNAGGEITGIVEVCHDITDREQVAEQLKKAKEEAEAASQAKSRFLANMSHELRTPLTTMIGMSEVLGMTPMGREQRDYLSAIRHSGQVLLSMIDDILHLSRIAAGKHNLVQESFDLDDVLDKVLDVLAYQAYEKGLELVVEVDSQVPTRLVGFPTALRQVLINIIGNAIKFTDMGEVTVRIRRQKQTPAPCLLRFEISDTGIGIPEDQVGGILEPFAQADRPPGGRRPGVGLGLSICRSLITLMNGASELHFSSEMGVGTTFSFDLEFSIVDTEPSEKARPGMDRLNGLRVLVAEGNAVLRESLVNSLGSLGLRTESTGNIETALQDLRKAAVNQEPFDQIIIGAGNPQLDGYALARAIKRDPPLAAVPVLLLVPAHDGQTDELQAEIGFEQYLRKPVRQPRLIQAVEAAFRRGANTLECIPSREPVASQDTASLTDIVSSGRILLVEDHPVNRRVLEQMLSAMGHAVHSVADGKQALQALAGKDYSLLLVDCQLPDMDGSQLTREIRRREGDTRHTPIVAVTALALEGERERCLAAGMDDYLTKPVTIESVSRVLSRWGADLKRKQSTAVPHGSPLDASLWRRYEDTRKTEPEFIPQLVDLFLESTRDQLAEMRNATNAGNWSSIERLAHAMKGACRQVGATRMADLCHSLELGGEDADQDGVSALIHQLVEEYQQVRVELNAVKHHAVLPE